MKKLKIVGDVANIMYIRAVNYYEKHDEIQ